MIETIMLIVVIFVLSGVFWYSFFYQKEKKLLNWLQQMLDCAIDGELERTEISEEKYSALENGMKQYIDCGLCMKVTLKTILPLSGQGLHPSKKIISSRKLLPLL